MEKCILKNMGFSQKISTIFIFLYILIHPERNGFSEFGIYFNKLKHLRNMFERHVCLQQKFKTVRKQIISLIICIIDHHIYIIDQYH